MKKSFFRHAFDIMLLAAFAWYGANGEYWKSISFLAIIVLLVIIEIGMERKNED